MSETEIKKKPIVYVVEAGNGTENEAYTTLYFSTITRLVEFLKIKCSQVEDAVTAVYNSKGTLMKCNLDPEKIKLTLRSGDTYHVVIKKRNKHISWFNINQEEVY